MSRSLIKNRDCHNTTLLYFTSLKIQAFSIRCQNLECSHNGQRLLAWATAYQDNWLTFSKSFVLPKRACMNTMSKLKRETVQRKILSRNKTNLMTEKITFFCFRDKKLKFQSSRCGVSPGFEKRVMCRGELYNKNNYLYYFLFMLHIMYVHTGHIGIHVCVYIFSLRLLSAQAISSLQKSNTLYILSCLCYSAGLASFEQHTASGLFPKSIFKSS